MIGSFEMRKRRLRPRREWLLLGIILLSGCVSYEAQPLDPMTLLRELDSAATPGSANEATPEDGSAGVAKKIAISAEEAAAWAVTHNPTLAALRAEAGIAAAQLIEAGLLPNPSIGFDFANYLAAEIADGITPTTADAIASSGLSWDLPRPGEISARKGGAQARIEEVRQRILEGEWQLSRAVRRQFLEVLGAQARIDQNTRLRDIVSRTAQFIVEARNNGAATAIQANLAEIDAAALEQDRVQLTGELALARLTLNTLLGLRPTLELDLKTTVDPFKKKVTPQIDRKLLTETAMSRRPDLLALLALYQRTEEALRLEVAQQWPLISIGSGISMDIPIFTNFNGYAIKTAMAQRTRIAKDVRAAVHMLRAEVNEAITNLENARRNITSFEERLLPRLDESLRLNDEAFREREVTFFEILTSQRQVLTARRNYLDAQIRMAQAELMVDTVAGSVLEQEPSSKEEEK